MSEDRTRDSVNCSDSLHRIQLPDADLAHFTAFFSAGEADYLLARLRREVGWQQDHIMLFGQRRALPRLTAWYGDPGATYTYSGITVKAQPWLPELREIRERIESVSAVAFNGVLLNLYRDGRDSVSWHADDEPELGRNPVIGSVSLGASRVFQMKHRKQRNLKYAVVLAHGSYLLMQGETQHHWVHQIPKSRGVTGDRINLTYRRVL